MTKPTTIQNLILDSGVSQRDVDRLARRLFTIEDSTPIIEGYTTTMPNFDDLPDTCKQFIRKALAFSTVVNVLDVDAPPIGDENVELDSVFDEGAHYAAFGSDGDA